jgi:small-conductance mechanosensitive channel
MDQPSVVGSFRFRKSFKVAPGVRLNINKKSVGLSTGVRGARYSVNSSGRRTRSIGIPGTGLSYRSQSGGTGGRTRETSVAVSGSGFSPSRWTASLVGWVTLLVFVLGIFNGAPGFSGTVAGIGIIVYIVLRAAGGILDPLFVWLFSRREPPAR